MDEAVPLSPIHPMRRFDSVTKGFVEQRELMLMSQTKATSIITQNSLTSRAIPSLSPTLLLPRLIPRRPLRRRRRQQRTNLLPPPPKIIIQPHPHLLILAIIHAPIVRIPALGHDLANQRVRPHDPRFRQWPIREMHDTGFPQHQVPVPALIAVAQVIGVRLAPEFAGE